MRNVITAISTGIGVVCGLLFGRLDGVLICLLCMISIDYVTGVTKGIVNKCLDSSVGGRGLLKKGAILLVVIVSNILDVYALESIGLPVCRDAVCMYYIANEGISIIENIHAIGLPVPSKLVTILTQLRGEEESNNNNNKSNK